MCQRRPSGTHSRPTVSFFLFGILLATLWAAGGGSRGDVVGHVVVRGVCWVVLITALFLAPLPKLREGKQVAALLAAAAALALIQMVPLPPVVWQALPGRELLSQAAIVSGQEQPWRPLSMVPGATANALSSLVVPLVVLILFNGMKSQERATLPSCLLLFIAAAGLVGLLQLSGVTFDNPLLNETPGEVAGLFANRNHFALLMVIGCILAPIWAVSSGTIQAWRASIALGLLPIFVMAILASGSRVGLVLGAAGLAFSAFIVSKQIKRALLRAPNWAFPAIVAGAIGLVGVLIAASIRSGRAFSVERMLALNLDEDMRSRGLSTVLEMVRAYFPWGSGLGGFDPVFRLHEPFELLVPTYFNHAHNDWLEILVDAGLPGALILIAGVMWWGWASARAWRGTPLLPRLGSALLLFIMVASIFDYPARTPIIMAIVVLAGLWLSHTISDEDAVSPLPPKDQPL